MRILLLFLATSFAFADDHSSEEKAVLAAVQKLYDARNARDFETAASGHQTGGLHLQPLLLLLLLLLRLLLLPALPPAAAGAGVSVMPETGPVLVLWAPPKTCRQPGRSETGKTETLPRRTVPDVRQSRRLLRRLQQCTAAFA